MGKPRLFLVSLSRTRVRSGSEAAPAHQECRQPVASPADPSGGRQGRAPGAGEAQHPGYEQEHPRDRGGSWQQCTQKTGLNRSILSTGWGEIEQMLCYIAWVVYVNPASTSQRCCRRRQMDKASRRSQSTFHCTSCGYQANGDLNAAQNILACGVGATARGEAFSRLDFYNP